MKAKITDFTLNLAKALKHGPDENLNLNLAKPLKEKLLEIAHHCAQLPDLDPRSADEILGYDDQGLPV